ncbi:HAD family hydrolase [Cryomorphaceae bacterium]|nr:HAD family hydrolase [Cryomorphaceae bacterium]
MKLFVFDIDDTLTRSESQHQTSYAQAMRDFGITDIDENWKGYLHHTDSYILSVNYERNLPGPFDFSFIGPFETRMNELIKTKPPVSEVPGAREAVDFIRTQGYAVAFATGSLLEPALLKLRQAEINHSPELVVGSNTIFEREGIVSEAVERARAHYSVQDFEHIISVGDGLWNLTTAQNLGLHFMGIGTKNLEDFNKHGLELHIEDWTSFDLSVMESALGIA